jgi:hypothetical protein
MDGSQLDDVVVFQTPATDVAESDEYCVQIGGLVLERIVAHVPGLTHSDVCLDDSWASVDIGTAPPVNVSIVWLNETPDHFVWALQFAAGHGLIGGGLRARELSPSERAVRQAVFTAAQSTPDVTDARWIGGAEFKRIYG